MTNVVQEIFNHLHQQDYDKINPQLEDLKFWVKRMMYCARKLNNMLENSPYLCGPSISCADYGVYSELSLFIKIIDHSHDPWKEHFNNLQTWLTKMSEDELVKSFDNKLDSKLEQVKKHVSMTMLQVSELAGLDSNEEKKKFLKSL